MFETAAVGPEPCLLTPPSCGRAGVAELADALDLGSSDENRGGSSPPARTIATPGSGAAIGQEIEQSYMSTPR